MSRKVGGIKWDVVGKLSNTLVKETNKSMEQLLTEKIIPATPIADGFLRKSLFTVHMTRQDPTFKWVSNGNKAPYNLRVHEMLGQVNWSEPNTGPKYLENPVKSFAGEYMRRVQRGMRSNGF